MDGGLSSPRGTDLKTEPNNNTIKKSYRQQLLGSAFPRSRAVGNSHSTSHGSSESDFIHKRNEIYPSIADGELISEK